jgi:hypothetical protein
MAYICLAVKKQFLKEVHGVYYKTFGPFQEKVQFREYCS